MREFALLFLHCWLSVYLYSCRALSQHSYHILYSRVKRVNNIWTNVAFIRWHFVYKTLWRHYIQLQLQFKKRNVILYLKLMFLIVYSRKIALFRITFFFLYRLKIDNNDSINSRTTTNRLIKTSNGQRLRSSSIKLSTKVVDTVQRLRDTLIHELCHAATWLIDGELRAGHGPLWKKWWLYSLFLPLSCTAHIAG